MRISDLIQAFPVFITGMILVTLAGRSNMTIVLALAFLYTPIYVRLTRAEVLSQRHRGFVEAARALGKPEGFIALRHVLPNALAPALIQASVTIGFAILLTAGLSFVGAGVRPPTPEWGLMIAAGANSSFSANGGPRCFPGSRSRSRCSATQPSATGWSASMADKRRRCSGPRPRPSRYGSRPAVETFRADHRAGRDRRAHRRDRQRQVDAGVWRCSGLRAGPAGSTAGSVAPGQAPICSRSTRRTGARCAAATSASIVQNPRGALNPLHRVGEQIGEVYRSHQP